LISFALAKDWVFRPIFQDIPLYPYALIALIIVAARPVFDIYQKILRARQEALRYALQNFTKFATRTLIILILVILFHQGASGVLMGYAIAGVAFFFISGLILQRSYGLRWNPSILKECFSYSLPLIPNKIAGLFQDPINKVLINLLKSTSATGLFHVGSQVGSLVTLTIQSVNEAYLPWCFEQLENYNDAGKRRVVRISKTLLIMFSTFALISTLFCMEIFDLVAYGNFSQAWIVFPFFAFWAVFNFVKNVWLLPLQYNKRGVKYAPIATYVNLLSTVIMSVILIPLVGIIGAGVSILISRICSSFVMMYFSKRIQNIGHLAWEIYTFPIGMFILSTVVFLPFPQLFYVKLTLGICASLFAYWFIRDDISLIYKLLMARRRPEQEDIVEAIK